MGGQPYLSNNFGSGNVLHSESTLTHMCPQSEHNILHQRYLCTLRLRVLALRCEAVYSSGLRRAHQKGWFLTHLRKAARNEESEQRYLLLQIVTPPWARLSSIRPPEACMLV